jgi:predicted Zn finger-like uncharacterized protein
MLIVCPSCAMSYEIGAAALGAAGRSVRCAQCKETWFAAPEAALAAVPAVLPPVSGAEPFREEVPTNFRVERMAPPDSDIVAAATQTIPPAEAPSIAPDHVIDIAEPPAIEAEAEPATSIESVAARRARRRQAERRNRPSLLRRLVGAPTLIVASLVALAALVQFRDKVVRHVPQTASLFAAVGMPVNLRGLVFESVTSSTEMSDGLPVLIIEGTIANVTTRTLDVPRLRFALRNAAGHEVYAWTAQPPKPTVGSGNGIAFRTRLASPPPDGRDVIVRFFNRRDMTAGLQ